MRNGEVLRRVKAKKNILHAILRSYADWIGHILRSNCLLRHATERKIEGKDKGDGKTRKKT